MGMRDETCVFTRTGIEYEDEVLFVGVHPGYKFTTRDLLHNLCVYKNETIKDWWNQMNYTAEAHRLFSEPHPLRFAVVGKYDSYGKIENFEDSLTGLDEGRNCSEYQFMVHKEVAEFFLKKKLEQGKADFADVAKLVKVADKSRIQLSGNSLLGEQFIDPEEMMIQLNIVLKTKEIIERRL